MHRLKLVSAAAPATGVEICGARSILEQVLDLASPWLIAGAPGGPPAVTVYAGRDVAPGGAWRPLAPEADDDRWGPPRRLLVDDSRREVVVESGDPRWLPLYTLRLVRNALRSALGGPDVLYIHAGCVVLGDRAVLVVGGTRSGKTTTVLAALGASGARFVSNDDATVTGRDEGLVAFGWPRSIQVRLDTVSWLHRSGLALDLRFDQLAHPTNAWRRRAEARDAGPPAEILLLPSELNVALGRPSLVQAGLDAVVLPVFDRACVERSRLHPLGFEAALARLEAHREPWASEYDPFLRDWFAGARNESDSLLVRLAQLPCFELHQTLTSLGSSRRLLDDLVQRLPAESQAV